jgi:hypothetical protein
MVFDNSVSESICIPVLGLRRELNATIYFEKGGRHISKTK